MAPNRRSLLRMEMDGAQDLEAALRELGDNKAIRRALGRALLIAGEPAAKEARANAPRLTGELAEGIDISTTLSRRQRAGRGRQTGLKANQATVYIGAHPMGPAVLAEFGTVARRHASGKSTGAMPAKPFMRPAWEHHKFRILEEFKRLLWATIDEEAKRLARKQAALIRKGKSRK